MEKITEEAINKGCLYNGSKSFCSAGKRLRAKPPRTIDIVNARIKAAIETGAMASLENVLKELLFMFRKVMMHAPMMFVIKNNAPNTFRTKFSCFGEAESLGSIFLSPTVCSSPESITTILPKVLFTCCQIRPAISSM